MASKKPQSETTYKQFLDDRKRGYCAKLCDLHGKSLKQARKDIKTHVGDILKEIAEKRGVIEKFTIGKTNARVNSKIPFKAKEFSTWKKTAIDDRWADYREDDYDCLIVLAVFTEDCLPSEAGDAQEPKASAENPDTTSPSKRKTRRRTGKKPLYSNQHFWTLAFEQYLIQYFALEQKDSRLGNLSLESGGRTDARTKAGVVYVAIKLNKTMKLKDILDCGMRGYCENLLKDLKGKTREEAAQKLFEHLKKTIAVIQGKKDIQIQTFTIGRSHAKYLTIDGKTLHLSTKDFSTWDLSDGIEPLYSTLSADYNALVVLCGITVDILPESERTVNTENPVSVFTSYLYKELDTNIKTSEKLQSLYRPRADEEMQNTGETCGVIYLAVNTEKRIDDLTTKTEERKPKAEKKTPSKKDPTTEPGKGTDITSPVSAKSSARSTNKGGTNKGTEDLLKGTEEPKQKAEKSTPSKKERVQSPKK